MVRCAAGKGDCFERRAARIDGNGPGITAQSEAVARVKRLVSHLDGPVPREELKRTCSHVDCQAPGKTGGGGDTRAIQGDRSGADCIISGRKQLTIESRANRFLAEQIRCP